MALPAPEEIKQLRVQGENERKRQAQRDAQREAVKRRRNQKLRAAAEAQIRKVLDDAVRQGFRSGEKTAFVLLSSLRPPDMDYDNYIEYAIDYLANGGYDAREEERSYNRPILDKDQCPSGEHERVASYGLSIVLEQPETPR